MKALSFITSSIILTAVFLTSSIYAAEHEVKMLNSGKDGTMVFEPAVLKVAVGDTVKFVSTDAGHNSVSDFTPEGAATWKSELGKDISITIDKEGVYIYSCDPHKVMAMFGVIQAGEAKNLDEAMKAAKEIASNVVMNKDRLDNYLAGLKK